MDQVPTAPDLFYPRVAWWMLATNYHLSPWGTSCALSMCNFSPGGTSSALSARLLMLLVMIYMNQR